MVYVSKVVYFSVVLLAFILFVDGKLTPEANDDLITHLPGLLQQPSFAQYSGFIAVNDEMDQPTTNATRHLHYWFVESQNDPSTDPVVLWLNGGPGCSSLLGLLTENGPFHFNENNDYLHENEYSWNKVANVIYLETPSGVGFSYGGNYTSGDTITYRDNYHFLLSWFQRFPLFQLNDFYIAGESYAGQYVPQLANYILSTNLPSGYSPINLHGLLCGNPSGLTSTDFAHNGYTMMRQHALISEMQMNRVQQVCNISSKNDLDCQELENALWQQNLKLIDPYNILLPCVGDGPGEQAGCFTQQRLLAQFDAGLKQDSKMNTLHNLALGQTFVPCGNYNHTLTYLHSQDVLDALHIPSESLDWDLCSQVLTYNEYVSGTPALYQKMAGQIRMWVYSGDQDTCVPFLTTQYAVGNLGFNPIHSMRPWYVIDPDTQTEQIAGYVEEYDSLSYITVKASGHMVPADKPASALTMFKAFLQGSMP